MKRSIPPFTFLFSAMFIFCVAFEVAGQKTSPAPPCVCPLLQVNTHFTAVRAGDIVEFTATRKDGKTDEVKYKWTVSGGTIISGKGTSSIRVRTTPEMFRKTVIAAVAPDFGKACRCPAFSGTIAVGRRTINVNSPANVTRLTLDETDLTTPCSPGVRPISGKAPDDMLISVSMEAEDKENDVLVYNYTVTGGKIVGPGTRVKWDLTGAMPGTYSITASVDDGCGICGKTVTKSVTVRQCDPKGF